MYDWRIMEELIKNNLVGRYVSESTLFCNICENRGRIKVVLDEDINKFDKLFDKYDDMGIFTHSECYENAINECKYKYFYCPYCEKGQKYIGIYERFEKSKI